MVLLVIMAIVNKKTKYNIQLNNSFYFIAINYPALNNLLQMFTNNMNLNANKLPILVPSNSSSNITSNSQHGSNQSLNIQEQQQHTLNSPRSPLSSTSNNNESSLLMCGLNTHLNPNSGLTSSNNPYPTLYANNANPLPNAGAGKLNSIII